MFIIDPPTPFDQLADWERHLGELQDLLKGNPGHADLIDAIAEAERMISELT